MAISLTVNGKSVTVNSSPDTPLLWVLRDELGLAGTKFGCGKALCGACTVHLNGMAIRSCQTPIGSVAGQKVTTIEGLSMNKRAEGLGRAGCSAVRLLPARSDDVGHGAARVEQEPLRRRYRRVHVRATSAAAAPIHAFALPSSKRRRPKEGLTHGNRSRTNPAATSSRLSAAVGGGLALGFYLPGKAGVAQADAGGGYAAPNAWVKIDADNQVTILVARSEMGQGVATSMPMLVAEELEVDINKVKVEFAPPAEVYINSLLGGQLTGGSTSVRDAWEKLRKAGASARMMLVAAAAQEWGVDASTLQGRERRHQRPRRQAASPTARIAPKAAQMEVPKDVPLKPVERVQGRRQCQAEASRHPAQGRRASRLFGIDTRVPGMLYAAVAMSPYIGGKVKSYDDSRAKKMPGRQGRGAVQPRRCGGCRFLLAGEEGQGPARDRMGSGPERRA